MILHALYDYYLRKSKDPDAHMAPPGFEWKEIPFIIELDEGGRLIQIEDTRSGDGKKKVAQRFLVPQAVKKTSGVAANLLWDNVEYVLGLDTKGKPERVRDQHRAFKSRIASLPEKALSDPGVRAVWAFLENLDLGSLHTLALWPELAFNPFITFRLQHDLELVCQRPAVIETLASRDERSDEEKPASGICLVTGESDEIERLHPAIKGVWGAQTSGANIVSFNLDAFNSYGKTQGSNAPVGKRAAFGYTTALNHLLAKDSRQRIQVGDASAVFWAERPSPFELEFPDFFNEPPKDDPDRLTRAVKNLYQSPSTGAFAPNADSTRFYVLGLAPNAARIAIRFWHVSTIAELAVNIRRHFDDLEIVHADFEKAYLSLLRLLTATAAQGKIENVPPNLAGDVMRSILSGTPYPQTLLAAAVRRVRAERAITYARTALIKACLNRLPNMQEKELTVSLDESNSNPGYRLGRLFAVLEKIQEEANPGLNATIRDRFYGAASSTPVAVFSTLLKLKNHHLAKLDNRGRAIHFEQLIGRILDNIQDFPRQLTLADQGRFAIGYYHQQRAFYQKSTTGE